jgi:hypothetical protein
MIPQTAAPPPGTGGVQRELYCSSEFAHSTPQDDRILIPSIDVDGRLEGDLRTGPCVVDECSTLLLLLAI